MILAQSLPGAGHLLTVLANGAGGLLVPGATRSVLAQQGLCLDADLNDASGPAHAKVQPRGIAVPEDPTGHYCALPDVTSHPQDHLGQRWTCPMCGGAFGLTDGHVLNPPGSTPRLRWQPIWER